MNLEYIGPRGPGAVPLPQGWPMNDHKQPEETDKETALLAAKLAPVELKRPAGASPDSPAPTAGPFYREAPTDEAEDSGVSTSTPKPPKTKKPVTTESEASDGHSD